MSRKRSKRYCEATKEYDHQQVYSVNDGVGKVKKRASTKFDETVDLAIKLSIDTRQSDQLVRGSISLPNGTGKPVRVIAFCEGDEAEAARGNGAIEVGGQDLAEKITGGWMEFDVAIAHPSMMRFVGKLGRILGPKGLMPSPKSGTVTDRVAQAVNEFVAGKIEFRNDKEGNVHMVVGKVSFDEEKLVQNIEAATRHILSIRPSSVKGAYLVSASISSTMGPGFRIAV